MNTDKTVLLVEDNEKIMEANRRALAKVGYHIEMAFDLAGARDCLARNEPDVIVLDIMLPDGSGLDFLAEIREDITAPVLLLTALGSKDDRLEGLRAGGDDYITKPYDLDELRERVAAFLRRKEIYEARTARKLVRGPLVLDLVAQRAYLDDEDMLLTQKEYALLLLLAQNEGRAVDTTTLYEAVWKAPMGEDANAIKIALSRLRKKLINSGLRLAADRGEGYRLEMTRR